MLPSTIYYDGQINPMDIADAVASVGAANIARMEILGGPAYQDLEFDRERIKKTINDELKKQRVDGFGDKYTAAIVEHLVTKHTKSLLATTSTGPLEDAHEDASAAIDAAVETSAVVSEFPQMLHGFMGDVQRQHLAHREREAQELQRQENDLRVQVKRHCDRIVDSLEEFSATRMTEWGRG